MPPFILYLLKANLVLLLFLLAYRLLLRRLTFYAYNRWFLLAALLFSVIFPLLDFSQLYAQPSQLGAELIILIPEWAGNAAPVQAQEYTYWHWALWAYAAGAIVMAGRFILGMASLWRMHNRSVPAVWRGQAYRQLQKEASPFSFWRTVYLNPKRHPERELQALMLHERAHTSQLHTLDALLAQLCAILCWFNPAAWLLRQDIRRNLEYIADEQVLRQGVSPKSYQYSLVGASVPQLKYNLAMSFNFNHIKSRIMMMNKAKSSPLHKLKYLLLPPAVLVLALVATTSRADVERAAHSLSQSITEQPQEPVKKAGITPTGVPQDSVVYFVDGKRTPAASIKGIDPKLIAKIDVLKGEKAQDLVRDADVKGVIKITTRKEGEAETQSSDKHLKGTVRITEGGFSETIETLPKDAVYILDEKQVSLEDVKQLNPADIKAVSVMKGESEKLVQKYGEKARNGVVMIYTKDQ